MKAGGVVMVNEIRKLHPFEYQINTDVSKEGIITSELTFANGDFIQKQYQYILDTQNKQIREALIKLGCEPPKEEIE
jgi:hypothetical protein